MLILIPLIVVSWGMKGKEKTAFRPAMALSSGEMSAIGGSMLLMTATATSRTVRLLMDELPEVKKWNLILNSPLKEGVTIVIPPTELLSPKFEVSLEPFIVRMRQGEIYLILVRGKHNLTQMLLVYQYAYCSGINKGCSVFLTLLKKLGMSLAGHRKVAFFHRNTTESRKAEILDDLRLPLNDPKKKLVAVVATVSLGKYNMKYALSGVDCHLYTCCYYRIVEASLEIHQESFHYISPQYFF